MTHRAAPLLVLLSSLAAFTPSCGGRTSESKRDGDASGDGESDVGDDADSDVGGDGDAGTGGLESDGETACERACAVPSECGPFSACVAECEDGSRICPNEFDAYLRCADGGLPIMCVAGMNLGISSSCLAEAAAIQACAASGS